MKKMRNGILSIVLLVGAALGYNHHKLSLTDVTDVVNSFASDNASAKSKVTFNRGVDGDTSNFIIKGQETTVRYLLIDTPESKKPNTPVQPYAKEASAFTNSMLTKAKKITLDFDKTGSKGDKYGRCLAYVYVDGKDLNELLVKKGLARVAYVYKPNTKNLNKYLKAQEYAKKHHLKIWSKKGYVTDRGFNSYAY